MIGSKTLSLLLLSFFLASCSTTKTSDRYREGDNKGQVADLTVEQEKQLTKEALVEMKKDFPPVRSQELQNYIERLGQKIVQANKLHNAP
jgi:predicted Zn-dependent protease